ncbi:MAG TPA: TVP38/TMEM64 family protein [Actinobacteria bacterium]|nr:TVP38/TMEM64 family protein [Actinomycetota bacterium]
MKLSFKLAILAFIILTPLLLFYFTPLGKVVDIENIIEQEDNLRQDVQEHLIISVLIYVVFYIAVSVFTLPGSAIMSVLAGFFYGTAAGILVINIGATCSAVAGFAASRYILGRDIQSRYSSKLIKFNADMESNGKNYLITLRIIPVFPFFLVNLLAGVTRIPLRTFIWTTSLGIIPGSFVYAYIGNTGASASSFSDGKTRTHIIIALFMLGILSILPVIIKKYQAHRRSMSENKSEQAD